MTGMLLFKLFVTPLLIAGASLAARRWGPAIGGWFAAMPLTSGPVSIFLALEQGPGFAARAAVGTLLGVVSVAAFCVAYGRTARVSRWEGAIAAGLAAFVACTWLLRALRLPALASFTLACGCLALALVFVRGARGVSGPIDLPAWDLPLRMIVATAIVIALTSLAAGLGPELSGLLSPFPVFAATMAVFSHRLEGSAAASHLLHGVLAGLFAFACFFAVVGESLGRLPLPTAYALAGAAAAAVHGMSLIGLLRATRNVAKEDLR
jgi:hypothetical protein